MQKDHQENPTAAPSQELLPPIQTTSALEETETVPKGRQTQPTLKALVALELICTKANVTQLTPAYKEFLCKKIKKKN